MWCWRWTLWKHSLRFYTEVSHRQRIYNHIKIYIIYYYLNLFSRKAEGQRNDKSLWKKKSPIQWNNKRDTIFFVLESWNSPKPKPAPSSYFIPLGTSTTLSEKSSEVTGIGMSGSDWGNSAPGLPTPGLTERESSTCPGVYDILVGFNTTELMSVIVWLYLTFKVTEDSTSCPLTSLHQALLYVDGLVAQTS